MQAHGRRVVFGDIFKRSLTICRYYCIGPRPPTAVTGSTSIVKTCHPVSRNFVFCSQSSRSLSVTPLAMNDKGSDDAVPAFQKLSRKDAMKKAVREYGATVIVFHTSISLCTLGISYAAVSSGLDVVGLLSRIGVGQSILESRLATGASTFVIAYAVHKVFAPARMATTLAATPLIVHYLRRIGFLKQPTLKT